MRSLVTRLSPRHFAPALAVLTLALAACAPAAPPSPTAAPAKPTEAPKPAATTAPAKPAATAAPAKPTEAPAAKPAEKPAAVASPAAKPTEAPAAKAEAKPAAFDEKAIADFYRGKNIRIIVGFAPGGNFDLFSRVLSRHLTRYMPGNPTVIVENRPGAASMVMTNAVYKAEAKDGTIIGHPNQNLITQQALGLPGIEFDVTKFQWLGAASSSIPGCGVRTDLGIKGIEDVFTRELATAADAPGSGSYDVPSVINGVLKTKFRLVPGYTGASRQRLAIEGKEAEAYCQADALSATFVPLLEGPNPPTKKIIILGSERSNHPILKDAVPAETLAKTDEDRVVLRAVYAPNTIAYPWAVAPEVPRDRVAALRKAMADSFKDPEFLAEAKKTNLDPDFKSGDAVARVAEELLKTPPSALARLKEMLK
ncbi:MAG: hypothetical protein HY718_16225 [Planctomycetes bacterium]|nr:hypothetical protein [Planctomycetota bacterium]